MNLLQKEMDAVDGPGKFYAHECDVTEEKKVNETFEWIEKEFKTVHILVNNAGTTRKNTFAGNSLIFYAVTQIMINMKNTPNNELTT